MLISSLFSYSQKLPAVFPQLFCQWILSAFINTCRNNVFPLFSFVLNYCTICLVWLWFKSYFFLLLCFAFAVQLRDWLSVLQFSSNLYPIYTQQFLFMTTVTFLSKALAYSLMFTSLLIYFYHRKPSLYYWNFKINYFLQKCLCFKTFLLDYFFILHYLLAPKLFHHKARTNCFFTAMVYRHLIEQHYQVIMSESKPNIT